MSAGRFQVIGQPTALPGKCYLTGSAGAESGPYIDTGQSIRGYGAVVFSAPAIEEMHRELKLFQGVDPDVGLSEEQASEKFNEGYENGYRDAQRKMEEYYKETILNDLARVVSNRVAGLDPFAPSVDEPTNVPEDSGKPEGSKSGTDGTSESPAPTSSGKGRGGVSGSSDDDPAAGLLI